MFAHPIQGWARRKNIEPAEQKLPTTPRMPQETLAQTVKTSKGITKSERLSTILRKLEADAVNGVVKTKLSDLIASLNHLGKVAPASVSDDLKYLIGQRLVVSAGMGFYRIRTENEKNDDGIMQWINRVPDKTKKRIAGLLLSTKYNGKYILGGQSCFICHGTSTEPLYELFKEAKTKQLPAMVATNALAGIFSLYGSDKIKLNALGGEAEGADAIKGRFRPEPNSLHTWLESVGFEVLVLSCSRISPDLLVSCLERNDDLRQDLIGLARKRDAKILVIADSSKLCSTNPYPKNAVKLNNVAERVWLFTNEPKNLTDNDLKNTLSGFRRKLGNRLVTVSIAIGRQGKRDTAEK